MISPKLISHQKEYEKTIFTLRRHWIVLVKILAVFVILAGIPAAFYALIGAEAIEKILSGYVLGPLALLGASAYALFIWLFIFYLFIDYYLDTWIITNDRIIYIEQNGLFSRVVSEHKLYKIQDVTVEVKGFLPTFLNYGNIFIQTAAERPRTTLRQIRRPNEVSSAINELIEKDKFFHQHSADQGLEQFKAAL